MSDTYGKSVTLTIFGESHGPAVGATVTGLAPGVPVDMEFMRGQMEKRRAKGKISTSRTEADAVRVLSGVYRGAATGTALTLVIENTNTRSGDYTKTEELLRPGHADYTAHMKYGGHQDARGGGHFSGRLTAPVVYSCDSYYAYDIVCEASSGQIVYRHGQTLKNRAISASFCKSLNQFVTNVACFQGREY